MISVSVIENTDDFMLCVIIKTNEGFVGEEISVLSSS
jgi:hypothetical protein